MKFEGIEIALEGIWYEDNRPRADFQRLSSYQIPSSAISIPSNFIFFKSLCGGERRNMFETGGREMFDHNVTNDDRNGSHNN